MSIVKNIEVIGESERSWEDATKLCIDEVSKSVRNIKSVWVKEMQAKVDGDHVTKFRVNCKISFVVDDSMRGAGA